MSMGFFLIKNGRNGEGAIQLLTRLNIAVRWQIRSLTQMLITLSNQESIFSFLKAVIRNIFCFDF